MASPLFTGRHQERKQLLDLLDSPSAELVSVTGRRRVGKTFLVKQTFKDVGIDFSISGLQKGSKSEQLLAFELALSAGQGREAELSGVKEWQVAFVQLINYLNGKQKSGKLILFFDELPWLATPKSGFLRAFSFFWNNWAVDQNILVIICGSAASWMMQKVVNDKGGLHNRITRSITLDPFTLHETREYLQARHFVYPNEAILDIYLALGGIPFYLRDLSPDLTPTENIDALCFDRKGALNTEFSRLYPALFERAERHEAIIRQLAKHLYGLTRKQLLKTTALSDGGGFTKALEELEYSGFIEGYRSFNRKKSGRVYRLIDEYSLFYLRFIEPNRKEGRGTWQKLSRSPAATTWSGYAFETVGLRHIRQIKTALGMASVATSTSTFYHPGDDDHGRLQIDLIIDRADKSLHLCEFKFYDTPVYFSPSQLIALEQRRLAFRELSGVKKTIFTTLIAPQGLSGKAVVGGVINQVVELDDLFVE